MSFLLRQLCATLVIIVLISGTQVGGVVCCR